MRNVNDSLVFVCTSFTMVVLALAIFLMADYFRNRKNNLVINNRRKSLRLWKWLAKLPKALHRLLWEEIVPPKKVTSSPPAKRPRARKTPAKTTSSKGE